MTPQFWKKCSSCKKEIPYSSKYYECSVSTCVGERKGYVFCSVPCWEVHLPTARHKDAAAIEQRSPARPAQTASSPPTSSSNPATMSATPARRIVRPGEAVAIPAGVEKDVLIVVSKFKKFIKDVADMNTSESVIDLLSDRVRKIALEAIENARKEGRKTVMDRDFKS